MKFPTIRIFKCPQHNCVKGTRHRAGYADSVEYYPCGFCNETGRIGFNKWLAERFDNWMRGNTRPR